MTLDEFLNQPNHTATALAAKLGCEVSTITRIAKGERGPSLDLALRIERATDGMVQPESFVAPEPQKGAA